MEGERREGWGTERKAEEKKERRRKAVKSKLSSPSQAQFPRHD